MSGTVEYRVVWRWPSGRETAVSCTSAAEAAEMLRLKGFDEATYMPTGRIESRDVTPWAPVPAAITTGSEVMVHTHYWSYLHTAYQGRDDKPDEVAVVRYCACGAKRIAYASEWKSLPRAHDAHGRIASEAAPVPGRE